MAERLRLGISPCPNDTFVFHQLLRDHGRHYELVVEDVEALNGMAARGELDIAKLSVAAFGAVREQYGLLRAGGAAGFGVGPLLVAREPRTVGGRIAIPGARTTAALLLRLLGEFETVPMRFDRIEDAVLNGEVDAGVLIHEGRFTYPDRGLVLLRDLGEAWERRMHGPLPLGAVAMRRSCGEHAAREFDTRLRVSIEFAFAHPFASAEFVQRHAREMDPRVIRQHIELYVNDYTRSLDLRAVQTLLAFGADRGLFPRSERALLAYE
jgi:1,4-dihydroxy-6-naphthoate synthase